MENTTSVFEPNEQVVIEIPVYETKKLINRRLIGLVILVVGIALFAVPLLYILGGILFLVGGFLLLFGGKKAGEKYSGYKYVITNQRAMILEENSRRGTSIVKSCSLYDTTASLKNVRTESIRQQNGSTIQSTEFERGDLAFMKNGVVEVVFEDIPSPKDTLHTIETLMKSRVG